MKQVVYVDILIMINIFVNYLLLMATSKVASLKIRQWRYLLGAFFGGAFSLVIFLPVMNIGISIMIKLSCSLAIVFASFGVRPAKIFLKIYGSFFLSNFVFAGLMFALWITMKPRGMMYQNGIVYFEINALVLISMAIFSYVIISVISFFMRRRAPENRLFDIEIECSGKKIQGKALLDTGNSLKDGFSDLPVIVAQLNLVKDIIPSDLSDLFEKDFSGTKNLSVPSPSKIRLIPYGTVKESGILPAFKATAVTAFALNGTYSCKNVLVAVTQRNLSSGEFSALLSLDFIESCKGVQNYDRVIVKNKG